MTVFAAAFWDWLSGMLNLGDDADTTGAVYGQLAGAYYGETGIPEKWRARLARRDLIEKLAEKIYSLGMGLKTDG